MGSCNSCNSSISSTLYSDEFINHCENGDLINAKKHLELYPDIDIHANKDEAFNWSCGYGYLEIAQWLWSLDQTIDIHADNEYAFRYSCGCGHLEVAKWLLSLNQNIDIHVCNEDAFCGSCERGHLEVAKWLCTLCSNYYLEHDDNKIISYKIR
jgi:hypothetical protein